MRFSIWHLILVLAFPASLLADDKITMKQALEPGQSWAFDSTQDVSSDNKASANGNTQPFTNKSHTHRAGKVVVLAVKDGAPTSLRITFDDSCESTASMTGQKDQKVPFPYSGKTVTIKRADDGSVTDDFNDKVDPASMGELHAMMEQEGVVLPKDPVSVGDEWPADAPQLAKLLQLPDAKDSAGMTLKLLSVQDVKGRPTAQLKVSMAVLENNNGLNIKLITQGTALIDIRTGHSIKLDMKGTTNVTGDQTATNPDGSQIAYHIEGAGTMDTQSTSDLTLADAPAPAPAAGAGGAPPTDNPLAPAPPAASYAGSYSDGKLTVDLTESNGSYTGTFTLNGNKYPATATEKDHALDGSFSAGANRFPFTAKLSDQTLTLISGGVTYNLKQSAANPLGN